MDPTDLPPTITITQTQQRPLDDANKPDEPLIDPSVIMSAKSNGSLFDGKKRRLGRDEGAVETPVDPMSSSLPISGKERPHGSKGEEFSHCDSPDARPMDGSSSTSAAPSKEPPHIHEKRRLSQETAPDDGPDESSVDTDSPKSTASGTEAPHGMKKRKFSHDDDPEPKKIRSEHPVDDGAQAFQRWLKRRLQRPPPAVFADTTIRREAQKLKPLPPEIRRMIDSQLFDAGGGRIRIEQAENQADQPLKFSIGGIPMEGAHYLNPRCVGDQIAAEAIEVLYEHPLDVDFLALFTLLQECCLFLPRKQLARDIRNVSVYLCWDRYYRGYGVAPNGARRVGINPADWIDPTEVGLVRNLDDYYSEYDTFGGALQGFYNRGEYKIEEHGGRAGLRALCQISRLKAVEFRLQTDRREGVDLRRIIPTVRFLRARNVVVTVWSGMKARKPGDRIVLQGRSEPPKWFNISDLFDMPSSGDEDLAAQHAHEECFVELTHTCQGDDLIDELHARIIQYGSGRSCGERGCVRVKVNELWKQLEDLMVSGKKKPPPNFGHSPARSPFDLRKYGSIPEAWAALEAEKDLKKPDRKRWEDPCDRKMRKHRIDRAIKSKSVEWPLDSRFILIARTHYKFNGSAGASNDYTGQNISFRDWAIPRP